jgi:trehalose 2-sulfotransferase
MIRRSQRHGNAVASLASCWLALAVAVSAHPRGRIDSYLICATPRTGSTLLCGLLSSAGVAGHPESYFRKQGQQDYAAQWGIARSPDGGFRYADYVRGALAAGRSGNGVFAARIMWETLEEVVGELRMMSPDLCGSISLLERAFGRMRFIYLRRDNIVAQAVSLLRAEQTNVWHDPVQATRPDPDHEAQFDFDRIHQRVQLIDQHNAAWQRWFSSAGIEPFAVLYEELAVDPAAITRRILDFLDLELAPGRELAVQHRRLADELSTQWIARYEAELLRS